MNAVELLGLSQPEQSAKLEGEGSAARLEQLLRQVAEALEAEDRYTRGHSDRVARYAESIARKMGLSAQAVRTIRAAALVHDVGKLRVPLDVLNKPGKLTDEEFALIKRHPVDGAEMVTGLQNDELTAIVRHHHERLDGHGYPDGLFGDQIPLGARIIAVADTFDAITSVRPYRPRREHKQALDILAAEQGHQLDSDAVRAFLACYSGRRTVAVWTIATSLIQRALAWLPGQASAATVTAGNLAAATVATVAIGGVAIAAPVVSHAEAIHAHGAGRVAAVYASHALGADHLSAGWTRVSPAPASAPHHRGARSAPALNRALQSGPRRHGIPSPLSAHRGGPDRTARVHQAATAVPINAGLVPTPAGRSSLAGSLAPSPDRPPPRDRPPPPGRPLPPDRPPAPAPLTPRSPPAAKVAPARLAKATRTPRARHGLPTAPEASTARAPTMRPSGIEAPAATVPRLPKQVLAAEVRAAARAPRVLRGALVAKALTTAITTRRPLKVAAVRAPAAMAVKARMLVAPVKDPAAVVAVKLPAAVKLPPVTPAVPVVVTAPAFPVSPLRTGPRIGQRVADHRGG